LSSAILYVAIVVIWAAVLIPRWLRRDPVVAVPAEEAEDAAMMETVAEELAPLPPSAAVPPLPLRRREEPVLGRNPRPVEARDERDEDRSARDEDLDLADDPAHRRVVSARKRLLLMLVVLAFGSGMLAGAKLAAWWVIVPPSIMLVAYVLLLREAAKADAQRRETARLRRAQAARAQARRQAATAGAKIIAIPSLPEPEEEELFDQYADAKLRAVGD
jgi:hypothetical protein